MSAQSIACDTCRGDMTDGSAVRCADCPGRFRFAYGDAPIPERPRGFWDFVGRLPVDPAHAVSLGEGATPLVPAGIAGCRLLLKLESQNPTGSQKDRALALAIAKARELGHRRVVIASTGSAGLACAAYCARAGLRCVVIVPRGTPPERLVPMRVLGATIVELQGTFVEIERLLDRLKPGGRWYDATTKRRANPFQAEAPKTIAYEIFRDLGRMPDWVVVPVGGGATLHGIWRGFRELVELGLADRPPRMAAVQPTRFNTLEAAMARGLRTQEELAAVACDEEIETIARNLKHGVPPDGADALAAVYESEGVALSVSDEEAIAAQTRLGREEGIFCEPSSAVVLPAAERLARTGRLGSHDFVVGIVTGSGFREHPRQEGRTTVALRGDCSVAEFEGAVDEAANVDRVSIR